MSDGVQQMIDSLRHQNTNQFERLTKLEEDISMIKADLFGATGNNGLRGEFRAYKSDSEKRESAILSELKEVKKTQEAGLEKQQQNFRWIVTTGITIAIAIPGVVYGVMRIAGG